ISLVELGVVPAWMVVVIVGREFAVSGLRSIAAAEGYTIEASELGKTKMVMQVVAVSLLVVGLHSPPLLRLGIFATWLVVLFAIISAVEYFRKFWRRVDIRLKVRRDRERLLLLQKQRKDVA